MKRRFGEDEASKDVDAKQSRPTCTRMHASAHSHPSLMLMQSQKLLGVQLLLKASGSDGEFLMSSMFG